MQTPKSRSSALETPRKISPRAVSSEVSQRTLSQSASSEVSQKRRAVRQLKNVSVESNSVSPNQATSKPKDRCPNVKDRKSPRSPLPEVTIIKRSPNRVSELESQISLLQKDLKKAKDQLSLSESLKNQAQQDAEEYRKQVLATSNKLEESQQQLVDLSSSSSSSISKDHQTDVQRVSGDQGQECQSEIKFAGAEQLVGSSTLSGAINEINQLKVQLDAVAKSEATQTKHAESVYDGLNRLKENLSQTFLLVEDMKNQTTKCEERETQTQDFVGETLLKLETAKETVEALCLDNSNTMEAYKSIASQIEESRAVLEEIMTKIEAAKKNSSNYDTETVADNGVADETREDEVAAKLIETELASVKFEVEQLKSALETAETRNHEEQIRSTVQVRSAYELMEKIKSDASQREAELEEELKRSKADIDDLKANLMDKETELQGICEENECLHMKLQRRLSCQTGNEPEKELKKQKEAVENLKANLMDEETELQNMLDENSMFKMETKKKDMKKGKVNDEAVVELNAARAAEQEAMVQLGCVTQEADKNNRRVARVVEELEAVRSANAELEAELRKLKVQSDQWRKAAEAAASMLSTGSNWRGMERTGSMESDNGFANGKVGLMYQDDMDDDLSKKRNGNMLKRIGVLWKRPQKMSTP